MRIVNARLPDSLASINYRRGRVSRRGTPCPFPIDGIAIHVTEGSAASVRSWFNNPRAEVSAHYMVRTDGGVEQFVGESDTAFHAGDIIRPTNQLVIDRQNAGGWTPNSWAIGIEHEGDGTKELTAAQRDASYELQLDIIARRKIPVDRLHIFGHHEVKATKPCPGAISVDRIVEDVGRLVLQSLAPSEPVYLEPIADPPSVVFSPNLGWIVPITVRSDTAWTFATIAEIRTAAKAGRAPSTMEAGTPLSRLQRASI